MNSQALYHVVFVLCFNLIAAGSMAETITIRADMWYPFNGQPEAKDPGYMIEIAQQAWQEAGYTLDYQLMSWDQSIAAVRKGEINCLTGAYKAEAPDLIFPKNSLGVSTVGFFGLSTHAGWEYQGTSSFKNLKIGVIANYNYAEEIDQYIADPKNSEWVYVASGEQPLQDLIERAKDGKVDIILETPIVFRSLIRKMWLNVAFQTLDKLDKVTELYIACSPNNKHSQQYVDLIDKKLIELRRADKLNKLLSKYGFLDWEQLAK